jgi:hypothetical protein
MAVLEKDAVFQNRTDSVTKLNLDRLASQIGAVLRNRLEIEREIPIDCLALGPQGEV